MTTDRPPATLADLLGFGIEPDADEMAAARQRLAETDTFDEIHMQRSMAASTFLDLLSEALATDDAHGVSRLLTRLAAVDRAGRERRAQILRALGATVGDA